VTSVGAVEYVRIEYREELRHGLSDPAPRRATAPPSPATRRYDAPA
jgi:hypothetical protein